MMGLFIVKTQVEAIGGKIAVKSELQNWTEFKIEFVVPGSHA
jgi:chemotaxis protein histidine kinase CheA